MNLKNMLAIHFTVFFKIYFWVMAITFLVLKILVIQCAKNISRAAKIGTDVKIDEFFYE